MVEKNKNMECILQINGQNKIHRLKSGTYLIGRNIEDIKHDFPIEDKSVDVKHAVLEILQNEAILTDLFSKTGTYINGLRLKNKENFKLQTTSSLKFGNVGVNFRFVSKDGISYYDNNNTLTLNQNSKSDTVSDSFIRVQDSQDLNAITIDESTSDSDNLLKYIAMPVDENTFQSSKTKSFDKKNSLQIKDKIDDFTETVTKRNNHKNFSDDDETDCEEELFNLRWSDSVSNTSKTTKSNHESQHNKNKSGSVTPNIDLDVGRNKVTKPSSPLPSYPITNDQDCGGSSRSASITPNLDLMLLGREPENNFCTTISTTPEKLITFKQDDQLFDDNDDDFQLTPTQPFFPKSLINPKPNKNNEFQLSPTQPFFPNRLINPKPTIKPSINSKSIKTKTEIISKQQISSSHFVESNNDENSDSDVDIEATQIFVYKKNLNNSNKTESNVSSKKSNLKNTKDKKKNDFVRPMSAEIPMKVPVISLEKIVENDQRNDNSNAYNKSNHENDVDDFLDATQQFIPKKNLKMVSNMKKKISSSTSSSSSSKLGVDKSTPKSEEFGFSLPSEKEIMEAGDIFKKLTKNNKHNKLFFEVHISSSSSGSSDDDDDDDDKYKNVRKKINIKNIPKQPNKSDNKDKNHRQIEKKKGKSANDVKNVEGSDNNREKREPKEKLFKNKKEKFPTESTDTTAHINDNKNEKLPGVELRQNRKRRSVSIYYESITEKENGRKKKTRKNELHGVEEENKKLLPEETATIVKEDDQRKKTLKSGLRGLEQENEKLISEEAATIVKEVGRKRKSSKDELSRKENKITALEDISTVKNENNRRTKKVEERKSQKNEEKLTSRNKNTRNTNKEKIQVVQNENQSKEKDKVSKKKKQDENDEMSEIPGKRARKEENQKTEPSSSIFRMALRSAKPKIVFTMVDGGTYKNQLQKIDAKIVTNPEDCTMLITEKIFRTWKFMAAMAKGIPILSPKWILDAANTANNYPLFDDYIVKDEAAEKSLKFNLKSSLTKAQERSIFEGYSFFITPQTKPPPEELNVIINCGKGRILRTLPTKHQNIENFFVISDRNDINLWSNIREILPGVKIIKTEGIMIATLQQQINFKRYQFS